MEEKACEWDGHWSYDDMCTALIDAGYGATHGGVYNAVHAADWNTHLTQRAVPTLTEPPRTNRVAFCTEHVEQTSLPQARQWWRRVVKVKAVSQIMQALAASSVTQAGRSGFVAATICRSVWAFPCRRRRHGSGRWARCARTAGGLAQFNGMTCEIRSQLPQDD